MLILELSKVLIRDHVITQKGIIDKEIFSFPTNLVQGYDGDRIWFKVTEEEARNSYIQSQNVNLLDQGDSSINNIETETTYDNSLSNTKTEERSYSFNGRKIGYC